MAVVTLTSGADTVVITQNSADSGTQWGNTYNGGAGIDVIDLTSHNYAASTFSSFYTLTADSTGTVTLTSTSAARQTMKFVNFETLKIGTRTALVANLGTAGADTITGGALADNWIFGLGGNDTIDGGAGTDIVSMQGARANYTVTLSGTTYTITDNVAGRDGTDTLTNIESVKFTDGTFAIGTLVTVTPPVTPVVIDGTAGADNLTGNTVSNTINGLAGNDILTASGGTDTMNGGLGDDTYNINDAGGHVVNENANEGTDTVNAAVSYTLTANVENLVLTGSAGINGTGNALNNRLTGNSGSNMLTGGGGTDTAVYSGVVGSYTITATDATHATISGPAGTDTLSGITNIEIGGVNYTVASFIPVVVPTDPVIINGTANADTLTGNSQNNTINGLDGNDTLTAAIGADTLVGGLGDDIYVINAGGNTVTEAANEGIDTVRSAITYTLSANVENLELTGTGASDGTGNALDNRLTGNSGNNTLTGGGGTDTAVYSGVLASYTITATDATHATISGPAGTDTLSGITNIEIGGTTYTVASFISVVPPTDPVIINGTANADTLTGNAQNNTINGLDGNDTLIAAMGADTLVGGLGDDIYVINAGGNTVTEAANEGIDTVRSAITYALGANVEDLELTGTGAIDGTGNSLNNRLTGNSGSNMLTGLGGDDMVDGGAGDDTLVFTGAKAGYEVTSVNATTIRITDLTAGRDGIETVTNVENFTFSDGTVTLAVLTAGTGGGTNNNGTPNADNLMGDATSNTIYGLAGNDIIDGAAGADMLYGGDGNDIYIVDNTGDRAIETSGGGIDTVKSSISLALGAYLETLVLTGTSAINGLGNALNNRIYGNSGSNRLSGGSGADAMAGKEGNDILDGGSGADRLYGGQGNDIYIVDNRYDRAIESAGAGRDLVKSSVTFTLGTSVEDLSLTGTANISGVGNALGNIMTGNGAANRLTGGAGKDALKGGNGHDIFDFNSLKDSGVSAQSRDVILDFKHAADRIDFSTLDGNPFAAGNQALKFIGWHGLSGRAGEVNYAFEGNNTVVSIDIDGDRHADFQISLTGRTELTAADFIL